MKRVFASVASVLLLSVICIPSGYSEQEEATLVFARTQGDQIEVKFTTEELERVSQNSRYLLTKLDAAGVKCCEERQRISDCIWRCCDRSKVSTCDATLVKALEELWGK